MTAADADAREERASMSDELGDLPDDFYYAMVEAEVAWLDATLDGRDTQSPGDHFEAGARWAYREIYGDDEYAAWREAVRVHEEATVTLAGHASTYHWRLQQDAQIREEQAYAALRAAALRDGGEGEGRDD